MAEPERTSTWRGDDDQRKVPAKNKRKGTYSATGVVGARLGVEGTVLVLARTAEVVTLDLHVEVKLGGGGRAVLEQRKPLAIVVTDTKVDRGPVTDRRAAVTPLATSLGGNTLGVNIVLSGSGLVLPLVVGGAVGASQGVKFAVGSDSERDGLGFGTCRQS